MCFKYTTYLTIYKSLDKSFINFHQKNLQFNVQIILYCLCLYFGQKNGFILETMLLLVQCFKNTINNNRNHGTLFYIHSQENHCSNKMLNNPT